MIKIVFTISRLEFHELEDSLAEGNKLTGDNVYC